MQENYDELNKATQYAINSNWLATGNIDKFLGNFTEKQKNGVTSQNIFEKALKG